MRPAPFQCGEKLLGAGHLTTVAQAARGPRPIRGPTCEPLRWPRCARPPRVGRDRVARRGPQPRRHRHHRIPLRCGSVRVEQPDLVPDARRRGDRFDRRGAAAPAGPAFDGDHAAGHRGRRRGHRHLRHDGVGAHRARNAGERASIYALAAITWCALGDRWGALCGALAAVIGPAVEAGVAAAGLARYADDSDALFGVAPWLPALYFAFGLVVALLAEIGVRSRYLTTAQPLHM